MSNYLQPIQPWVSAVMSEREKDKITAMYKTPFITMASAALVAKAGKGITSVNKKEREGAINEFIAVPPSNSYKGCIIANNSNNLGLSYSLNETILGIDFDGKYIKVEGETGRKISTPIITSLDVDTEEANNAIKTTRVSVKCFSLKQLEMFELFFMRPGMNVIVEWGDSSLLARSLKNIPQGDLKYNDITGKGIQLTPYTDVSQALFIKENNKWQDFCCNFSDIYMPNQEQLRSVVNKIRKTLGSYEYSAGKVSEYSYSIADDGTYDCVIEILQSNQISLAIPKQVATKKQAKGKAAAKKALPLADQIKEAILSDFGIDPTTSNGQNIKAYEAEWFNFNKKNEQQKDTLSNSDAYISFRFITKYLMNLGNFSDPDSNNVEDDFVFQLPKYKVDGKEIEYIPVHSSKYLISSSPDVLYPNKNLPDIQINKGKDADENKFTVAVGKEDGTINKYTFNSSAKKIIYEPSDCEAIVITNDDKTPVGNALNIFVKYARVVQMWNRASTKGEFIRDVLDLINKNSYGLFKLVLQPKEQGKPVTIVDYKFAPKSIKELIDVKPIPYRFKPTTINSIVRKFTFNFQMDNLVAGKMFFDSAAQIRDAYAKKKDPKNAAPSGVGPTPYSYKSFDNSAFGNADGWFSVNNVEVKRQEKLWERLNLSKPVKDLKNETDSKIAKDPPPDLSAVLKSKSIYYNVDNKKNVRLVYGDRDLIQNKIGEEELVQKSIISPIDISLTIDGFSGFRAGQCFNVDGVPEIYNKIGMFQITNIKHNITVEDGWLTTIEASLRVGISS